MQLFVLIKHRIDNPSIISAIYTNRLTANAIRDQQNTLMELYDDGFGWDKYYVEEYTLNE
jgi:hypothetical protein